MYCLKCENVKELRINDLINLGHCFQQLHPFYGPFMLWDEECDKIDSHETPISIHTMHSTGIVVTNIRVKILIGNHGTCYLKESKKAVNG